MEERPGREMGCRSAPSEGRKEEGWAEGDSGHVRLGGSARLPDTPGEQPPLEASLCVRGRWLAAAQGTCPLQRGRRVA